LYKAENISHLFSIDTDLNDLLKKSSNPADARKKFSQYLDKLADALHDKKHQMKSLEWLLRMNCINTLREIISLRSEKIAEFNLIELLWKLAREDENLPPDLSEAFFEDMSNILKGALGKSDVYEGQDYPEFMKLEGREAAVERSKELDHIALETIESIKKYPSGLDRDVIEKRKRNRSHILDQLQGNEDDWNSHLWQIRNVIRNRDQLQRLVDLNDKEKKAIDLVKENQLPFGITPYYVSLMDQEPHRKYDHAVRAQVIPPLHYVKKMLEHRKNRSYSFDFMHEHDTSPVDLITRRYPQILILKPYNTCSQICVYCQRNWEIDDVLMPNALASKNKIMEALDWVKNHPEITEILVTGGDPLVMQDSRIHFVLSEIAKVDHVERIRIGSRTPVVLPMRITDDLIKLIGEFHLPGKREICLVTHFEHPYEITPESMTAVQKFRKLGISVYNQAVFTVENSRRFELVALRRFLRLIGVDPYYSFNTKGKEETKNYRVPMARLQQEVKEEARLMPGMIRTDEPVYNVPRLGKNYVRAEQHHTLLTILADGSRVYEYHPWEKYLSLTKTYIDRDVPILDYLRELEKRGEDIKQYKTIWYYF
jgi:lysine 2,3-aminomutase